MAGQGYQASDLASVLRTLASFAPPGPPGPQNQRISPQVLPHTPPDAQPSIRNIPEAPPTAPAPKIIDPATITDWSSGLKCVIETVVAHETIIREIRRMIKVQHEHEEQWWNGRQALLKRQASRAESQRKLDEVLKAVGGAVTTSEISSEDFAEELAVFDQKVHRAQTQMVQEISTKLKGFGVPFFGTRSELILSPGSDEGSRTGKGGVEEQGGGEVEKKKISREELVELQRRMIGILEDLCCE